MTDSDFDRKALADGPYQLLPHLSDDDFEALKASIAAHGVLVPVEYDEAGNILDGHHRVAVCKMLGLADWPRLVRKGLTEEEKRGVARQLNLARRHLSNGQKQQVIKAQLKDSPKLSSRAIAAKLGVDHKTVGAARRRMAEGGEIPHLETVLGRNGVSQPAIKPIKTMYLPEKANVKELKNVAKQIRTAELAHNRKVRLSLVGEIAKRGRLVAGEMPRSAFPIGYADPPWKQEAWSDETGQDKGLPYPSMSLDEIKALCAGDRSPFTRDAVLFLWVTTNRLHHGMQVLEAWGFEYKSAITWDKVHIGMGRLVRDRTEHLLIGTRGTISLAPEMGIQPESLYSEAKTEHSRKPVWFAEQIDRLYPDLPKLELFQRRASLAEGDVRLNGKWEFWGNEAGVPEGVAA